MAGGKAGPRLVAVVAMAENRVIGVDDRLPWRLPADLARFKRITLGKPVLMGRRTFLSVGRPLPGRHNIVLTRDLSWSAAGVTIAHSLEEALAAAGDAPELMVIGGAEIYALCWPLVDRVEMTLVHARPAGDTRLACFDAGEWHEIARERHAADDRHDHDYSFVTLERAGTGCAE